MVPSARYMYFFGRFISRAFALLFSDHSYYLRAWNRLHLWKRKQPFSIISVSLEPFFHLSAIMLGRVPSNLKKNSKYLANMSEDVSQFKCLCKRLLQNKRLLIGDTQRSIRWNIWFGNFKKLRVLITSVFFIQICHLELSQLSRGVKVLFAKKRQPEFSGLQWAAVVKSENNCLQLQL